MSDFWFKWTSDLNGWHCPGHLEVWQAYLCWVFIFFCIFIKCKKLLFRLLITNPTWYEGQSRVVVQPFECIGFTANHVYWQEVGRSWLAHNRWQRLTRPGGTILWKAIILPKIQTYSGNNSFFPSSRFINLNTDFVSLCRKLSQWECLVLHMDAPTSSSLALWFLPIDFLTVNQNFCTNGFKP